MWEKAISFQLMKRSARLTSMIATFADAATVGLRLMAGYRIMLGDHVVRKRKRRMEEPLTEELLQELLSAPDVKSFCEEHRIQKRSLSDYLAATARREGTRTGGGRARGGDQRHVRIPDIHGAARRVAQQGAAAGLRHGIDAQGGEPPVAGRRHERARTARTAATPSSSSAWITATSCRRPTRSCTASAKRPSAEGAKAGAARRRGRPLSRRLSPNVPCTPFRICYHETSCLTNSPNTSTPLHATNAIASMPC